MAYSDAYNKAKAEWRTAADAYKNAKTPAAKAAAYQAKRAASEKRFEAKITGGIPSGKLYASQQRGIADLYAKQRANHPDDPRPLDDIEKNWGAGGKYRTLTDPLFTGGSTTRRQTGGNSAGMLDKPSAPALATAGAGPGALAGWNSPFAGGGFPGLDMSPTEQAAAGYGKLPFDPGVNFGGDFDELQKAIYESQMLPARAEIEDSRSDAANRMSARLASSGLLGSGVAARELSRSDTEYARQLRRAGSEAGAHASQQRQTLQLQHAVQDSAARARGYGLVQGDLARRNQLALGLRGQDLTARGQDVTSRGQDIQRELGFSNIALQERGQDIQERANIYDQGQEDRDAETQKMLSLLGMKQEDLARMDDRQLRATALVLDAMLRNQGQMIDASRTSTNVNRQSQDQGMGPLVQSIIDGTFGIASQAMA